METKIRLNDCQIFGCHDMNGIEYITCQQFGIVIDICSGFESSNNIDLSINLLLDTVGVEAIENG